jgi:hypothetical protein
MAGLRRDYLAGRPLAGRGAFRQWVEDARE